MAAVPQKTLNWLYNVLARVRPVLSYNCRILLLTLSAGIPRPKPHVLRPRTDSRSVSQLCPSNRCLQSVDASRTYREKLSSCSIWKWHIGVTCTFRRNFTSYLSRHDISISDSNMDSSCISPRSAIGVCHAHRRHAGQAWTARGWWRKSIPPLPGALARGFGGMFKSPRLWIVHFANNPSVVVECSRLPIHSFWCLCKGTSCDLNASNGDWTAGTKCSRTASEAPSTPKSANAKTFQSRLECCTQLWWATSPSSPSSQTALTKRLWKTFFGA